MSSWLNLRLIASRRRVSKAAPRSFWICGGGGGGDGADHDVSLRHTRVLRPHAPRLAHRRVVLRGGCDALFAILARGAGAHLVQVFRDGQRGLHVGSFPWIALSVRVGADTQAFARGDGRGRLRFDRPGDHVVDRGQKRRVAREVLLRRRDRPLAPRPERQPADSRHERRASPDPRQGTNVHPAFVVVPRVVRPRRGIVDGVGFLRFPAARASRTTRDGAPRGRAGSRAPARASARRSATRRRRRPRETRRGHGAVGCASRA